MLCIVLLLLANAAHVQPQPHQQGADMPLDLPPQPVTNIGPGVDMGAQPGQQPSLFVDAPINIGGGQTQFGTSGDLPQFGTGVGHTQFDMGGGQSRFDTGGSQSQFDMGGGQTMSGNMGTAMGTEGGGMSFIDSAGTMMDTGVGSLPHIDSARNMIGAGDGIKPRIDSAKSVIGTVDGGMSHFHSSGTVIGKGGGGMPHIDSAGSAMGTMGGSMSHIDSAGTVIGTGGGGMSLVGSSGTAMGAIGGGMSHIDSAGTLIGTGGGDISLIDSGPMGLDTGGTVIGGPGAHMSPGLDIGGPPHDLGQPPVMIDQVHEGMIGVAKGHGGGWDPVKPSECRALIDVMFLADGSDSINAADFNKLRNAIGHIISDLDLGPKRIRMGWVVFSTTVSEVQPLSYDKTQLIKAAEQMRQPRDGTMTDLAIEEAIREFERNGRSGVPRVAFTISDGISKRRGETLKQAKLARQKGIEMFAIGVGLRDNTELFGIASRKENVVSLANFDSLRGSLKQLTKQICPCPKILKKWLPPGLILEPGPRSIGSERNLMCENGLQGVGIPTLTCRKNSKWSRLKFVCKACPHPMSEFGNAMLVKRHDPKKPYLLGDVVEYKCREGYIIPTPITSTCGLGPKGPIWSDLVGQCSVCNPPRDDYEYMTLDQTGKLAVGSLRHYTCHKRLNPTGPLEIACIGIHGIPQWEGPMHSCRGCDPPPLEMGLARLVEPVYEAGMPIMKGGGAYLGEDRYYKCKHGYVETGIIKLVCIAEQWTTRWTTTEHSCTACLNEPPHLPNADLIAPGGQLIGDVRIYKCIHGYMYPGSPDGVIETICEAIKGHVGWRKPVHAHGCIACEEPLQIPPNAILDISSPTDTMLGTVRKYVCRDGFIQTGPITLGCVQGPKGPMWVPPEYICITCNAPPKLNNAVLDHGYGDNAIGSIRRYTCNPRYLPIGQGKITIECFGEMTGEYGIAIWGPPSDICHGCDDPPAMLGNAKLVGGSNLVGDTMEYKCVDKYHSIGPVEIKCLPTGLWSDPKYTCTACREPKRRRRHATLDSGPTLIGTTRFYKCDDGFINVGDLDITCMADATWSKIKFKCVRCLEPPVFDNAQLEPGKIDVYAVRRYTCQRGYLATGPITTTCSPPKKKRGRPGWSKPVHYCKDCEEPYLVDNADLIRGSRTIGSIQRYQCKKGFVPSRPPYSWCRPNAEWDPPEFKCIDPMPKKPKYPKFPKFNKGIFMPPVVRHHIHVVVPSKPKSPKPPKIIDAIPQIGTAFLINRNDEFNLRGGNDEFNMRRGSNDEFNWRYPGRSSLSTFVGEPLIGREPRFGLNLLPFRRRDRKR